MTGFREPMRLTSPTLHGTIWFTIAVFATTLAMAFIFQVEVVARGEGRVVPVSRVQLVQPEFSGRIDAIQVRNGDAVSKGDVLIELNPTDAIADLGTITAEQNRLQIETARLTARIDGLVRDMTTAAYPDQVMAAFEPKGLEDHPFTREQRRLLAAEIKDQLATMAQIDAREDANRRSEAVTNADIARVDAAMQIEGERVEIARQLLDQGTTSRTAFLDVQQAFTELEREREVHLRRLDQKVAERAALGSERRAVLAETRRIALDRLSEIDARLATLAEEERSARRRVGSARLAAPTDGIVDQLQVFTIGGMAEAGAELLRIVPTDAEVEIEGTFSNQDIGFMQVGQRANIRLDAYPSERFGFITGEVSDISADSTEVEEGVWGFVVRVRPDQSHLDAGTDRFALRPGMTATVDVTTDMRRIISYFFAPILRTLQDAMGER